MVTRQSSPNFFLRYQALIRPPGPPPTIARSSIDFCYLPAYGDQTDTQLALASVSRARRSAERKGKNPTPLQRFRAPIRRFRPPKGRTPPPETATFPLAEALLFLKGR